MIVCQVQPVMPGLKLEMLTFIAWATWGTLMKPYFTFLGRKAECVYTHDGPIETERCEPAINQLLCVNKCALVGLGDSPNQEPCLVVEPNRTLVRERGEMALRKEILESCNSLFPNIKLIGYFLKKRFLLMLDTMLKFTGLPYQKNGLSGLPKKQRLAHWHENSCYRWTRICRPCPCPKIAFTRSRGACSWKDS